MCVVAYGIATNVGSVDMADVLTAIAQVQANLGVIVRSVNGQKPNSAGNVTIEMKSALPDYSSYVLIKQGDFTPSEDGWLRIEDIVDSAYTGSKVIHKASGAEIFELYLTGSTGLMATGILPLRAGETYDISTVGYTFFHPTR